jgi:PAS domain S-box-containing protein
VTDPTRFLGDSAMAQRVRALDWTRTPLGPIAQWPQSLKIALGICLNSRFPMFVWWGPTFINIYNDAYAPILGKRHPHALGRPAVESWSEIWDIVGPQAEDVIHRAKATWNERVLLVMQRHGYTEDTYFTWSYSPIRDDAGTVVGLFCACTEDTAHVRAEAQRDSLLAELRAERARLEEVFRLSPSFVAVLRGPDHVFELANDHYKKLIGGRDPVGKPIRLAVPEVGAQGYFDILDRVYATGEPFIATDTPVALQREKGQPPEVRTLDFFYLPTRDAAGAVTGIIVHGIDLTEHKRAERSRAALTARLEQQTRIFDQALSSITDFVYVFDLDGRFRFVNKPLLELWGLTLEQAVGKNFFDLGYPPDLAAKHQRQIQQVIRTGHPISDENPYTSPKGKSGYYSYTFSPVFGHDGNVEFIAGSTRVITERRQWEQLLQSQNRHLTLALGIARLGTFDIDLMTDEVWVNPRGREIYGWSDDEPLTFAKVQSFFHKDDRAWVSEKVAKALAPGGPGAFDLTQRIVRTDGAVRWIRVRAIGVSAPDAPERTVRCVGTYVDITEAREAEFRLRESEERFRTLVAQVQDYAIFSTDLNGRALTWNEGVSRVLGYAEDEFIGLHASAIFTPEDAASGVPERELTNAARDGRANNDRWMMRKNGSRFFAMGMTSALRNDAGELIGFTKVMRDQTDWKFAQDELARHRDQLDALVQERTAALEASHQRLRLAERLASLGTLSAGLGHDMGNLLLPVRVHLESLQQTDLPAQAREEVHAVRSIVEYLQKLASGLRLLALDPGSGVKGETTELLGWWAEAQTVMKNTLPRGVTLHARFPATELAVQMSRAALTQVVFNLVQNAGDAMRSMKDGTVTVWAHRNNGTVALGVTDTGPGMSDEVRQRCMEPFYTTKVRGISTGLGLSLVYGFVREAGGSVELASAPGQGTTFTITLPSAPDPNDHTAPRRTALVHVAEPRFRSIIVAELQSLAYDVHTSATSPTPDLLVTDQASTTPTPAPGRLIVLDEPHRAPRGAVALGPRPRLQQLREALRDAHRNHAP